MEQNGTDLTPQQEAFVEALLACASPGEAAKKVGIGRTTAYRWLELPHLKRAYEQARSDLQAHAMERLRSLKSKAVDAIERNLEALVPPAVQLRAAQLVLEQTQQPAGQANPLQGLDLSALTDTELFQIESIMRQVEARKVEQDEKIIPMRKMS
jgi:phage terminase small subunit